MYSTIGRTALRASRQQIKPVARRSYASGTAAEAHAGHPQDRAASAAELKKGAKRDPELMILLAIMTGAFGMAGWHFSQNPTSSGSEQHVMKAKHSEPWKTGRSAVYMYHPGGDPNAAPKEAPSALNSVIVPNVNLPKSLHEDYNKYGKEGY